MQTETILMDANIGPPRHITTSGENVTRVRARRLRVLLVDDTSGYREALATKLRRIYGAVVEQVDSGEDCLDRMRREEGIDLILLDLMMTGLSGVDTYNALRAMGSICAVAFMSAYPDSDIWQEAERLGVPLLHKPTSDEQLEDVLLSC